MAEDDQNRRSVARLEGDVRELHDELRLLRETELELRRQLRRVQRDLDNSQKRNEELTEANAKLRADLDRRPSNAEVQRLEQQVAERDRKLNELKRAKELRKYIDTRELIKRDKASYHLGLGRIEFLPHNLVIELLQEACRKLDLSDVSLLAPAIEKMNKVISTVPAMQRFVREVCTVVFNVQASVHGTAGTPPHDPSLLLDMIIPTLKSWEGKLIKLGHLEKFFNRTVDALRYRSGSKLPELLAGPVHEQTGLNMVVEEIVDVVRSENQLCEAREALVKADQYIRANPGVLASKMVSHFQRLFDVPTAEGVFPKMNEVYLFVNETKNTLKALRSMLHLDPAAPLSACVSGVERLKDELDRRELTTRDSLLRTSQPVAENGRMFKIVGELKDMLSVSDSESVLPTVQKLMKRVRMYDNVFPGIDNLVSRLYDLLHVGAIEAIIPAVERLKEANRRTLEELERDTAAVLSSRPSSAGSARKPQRGGVAAARPTVPAAAAFIDDDDDGSSVSSASSDLSSVSSPMSSFAERY